jgi:hypothetical protein
MSGLPFSVREEAEGGQGAPTGRGRDVYLVRKRRK